MKKLLVSTIGFCAISAFNVNATEYSSEACDINLNGDLNFAKNTLVITTQKNEQVKITNAYTVFVDGKELSLSKEETKWVQAYYDGIEQSIPQVMTVAAEGMNIANYAVTEVLRGLLGTESKVASQLETKLNGLYGQLKSHVYQNPESLTFDTATLEKDLGFGSDYEAEVDSIVSEVMENAMGEFLVQMGRSMLSGEGSIDSFEERMNNMGDSIESKIEGQTESLEKEAKKLCEMMTSIDESETRVQKIKGLVNLDLLTKNNDA
jgi:hypothetical protein